MLRRSRKGRRLKKKPISQKLRTNKSGNKDDPPVSVGAGTRQKRFDWEKVSSEG